VLLERLEEREETLGVCRGQASDGRAFLDGLQAFPNLRKVRAFVEVGKQAIEKVGFEVVWHQRLDVVGALVSFLEVAQLHVASEGVLHHIDNHSQY
jgi:ureidoglycolate hydrolase